MEHEVLAHAETTAELIHTSEKDGAGVGGIRSGRSRRCAGKLHVALERGGQLRRSAPSLAVVRVADEDRSTIDGKVVEGDIHAAVLGAEGIVVHPHRRTIAV